MSDEMAEAHRRDYAEKRQINDLQEHIGRVGRADLANLSPSTQRALSEAFERLDDDSAQIVRRWD